MIGYRFGKRPPKNDYRTLRFRNYVTAALAPPPAAFNDLDRVYDSLHTTDPTQLFPMDGNDRYGDCTIAALGHAITVYRGLIGTRRIMTERAVLKLYMHLTGGVDSGLNELDVLGHDGHGFGGHEGARREGGGQRKGKGTPEVTVGEHGRRPRYAVGVARYNRER